MSLDTTKHYPVMLAEVVSYLSDNKNIIDCTFGGGGYSLEILKKFPKSLVTGIDRDKHVTKYANQLISKYPERFNFKNIKFSDIKKLREFNNADFFIFDLGVSNFQLKDMSRGFSFFSESKLDMGMGLNICNAYDLTNKLSESELKNIFKLFGEEKFSSKIAKKIVNFRLKKIIKSPKDLSQIIQSIKPRIGKTDPSTKSFQALRMVVNKELSEIFEVLKFIIENCKVNATIIVVTFHSLEDSLVKKIINFYGKKKSISRYLPLKEQFDDLTLKILTNKPIVPTLSEIKHNPSSRSAKLRVVRKIKNPNIILERNFLNMEKYFAIEDNYV